jgi:hypothetical protein
MKTLELPMPGQLALFQWPALRTGDPHCRDCGVDTGKIGEGYMVHDELRPAARSDDARLPLDGMLCLACLERRFGRPLVTEDFMWGFDPRTAPRDEPMEPWSGDGASRG